VELIEETKTMIESRTDNQTLGYQYRSEQVGGNTMAKYATASVFAPLIFTIPFSSMVETPGQENQMMMNGANFTKNIISGLTILALFLLLKRGDWRKHVLPIATMCGYLVVLVFSNFAHSERFHFPVLALELMFAAYAVTQLSNKHKRWYVIWLVVICVANVAWAWVKLRGRGMA
jgi:cytochrome bd-type quinol oxidase subunit 2